MTYGLFLISETYQDSARDSAESEQGTAEHQHWSAWSDDESVSSQRADHDSVDPRLRRVISAQMGF